MLITRLNFWTLFSSRSPCLMVDWGERGVKRERGRYIQQERGREVYTAREELYCTHLVLEVFAVRPVGDDHTPNFVDLAV